MQVAAGATALPLPMKPKLTLPLAGTEPFHGSLRTVTVEPVPELVPPHSWATLWPEGQVQLTVQPLSGELPACTVTSPWKPPPQELITRIVAEHAPVAPPDGDGLGLGDGLAEGLGDGLGLTDGLTDGLGDGLTDGLGDGDGLVVGPPHADVESSQAARRSIQSSRYCT